MKQYEKIIALGIFLIPRFSDTDSCKQRLSASVDLLASFTTQF